MQRQLKLLGEYAQKNDEKKIAFLVKSLKNISSKYPETSDLEQLLS